MDQVPRRYAEGRGLAQLLGSPGVGGLARDAHMDDAARGELDDEEGEQGPEAEVGELEEVAGPDLAGVGAQERGPGLPARAWRADRPQVLLDGALAHPDAQLAQLVYCFPSS